MDKRASGRLSRASADVIIDQRDEPGYFYPSWAASLDALWIGSHVVLTDVVF
jgi:hypothetical protein